MVSPLVAAVALIKATGFSSSDRTCSRSAYGGTGPSLRC